MQPAASDLVDHRVHPFFQASAVKALFAGRLEGDPTFAEFGIEEVPDHHDFIERLGRRVPPPSAALRIDGEFEHIRARSVPRRRPPYRSLAEIAQEQHVFELSGGVATMVGFRFPDLTRGLEVPGHITSTSSTRRASAVATSSAVARAASRCAWTRRPSSTWSSLPGSRSAPRSRTRTRSAASRVAAS